jgi:hypothetical protein
MKAASLERPAAASVTLPQKAAILLSTNTGHFEL